VAIKRRQTDIGPQGLKRVFVCLTCGTRWIEVIDSDLEALIREAQRVIPDVAPMRHCHECGSFCVTWPARPDDLQAIAC
jgi:hypothetical protein